MFIHVWISQIQLFQTRLAFSVFAFLVGFGIEAAVGSVWIADNQGKNGITVKAVTNEGMGGGGAVNGRRGMISGMISGDSCGGFSALE